MNTALKPLPWQQTLWLEVTTLALQGRLTHALLLCGPRGIGKRHFARALMAFILCEARDGRVRETAAASGSGHAGAGVHACGVCRSCQQYLAGSHPNAIFLTPVADEKTGKLKREIAVEQIRDFSEKLQLTSHYGQAKVALIEPADALNTHGVNALLKTIEEPLGKAHMLLVSERPMALAPTLRSRCQRLRFAVPAQDQALAWLGERGLEDAAALAQAHGAPLQALELKESGLLDSYRQWASGMREVALQKRDPVTAAGMIEKDRAAAFLGWLQQWLTQMLKQKLAGSDAFAQSLPASAIEQLLRETLEGQRRLNGYASPQMLIEALMVLWWRLARGARVA